MKRIFKYLFLSVIVLSCGNNTGQDVVIEPPVVSTIMVREQDLSIPVSCAGRITTKDEIKLSFKQGGVIESVLAVEGETVKRGQLLARLKQTEFVSANTQAGLAFEKAERDFERVSNLYKDSVATLEQYQNAATAIELARQTLESVRFNLSHTEIRAPANGRILKKLASADEITGAGIPVILFGSTDSKWILGTSVSDRDIVKLAPGDSAIIETDALPGKIFRATVSEISAMADVYTGTFDIELLIEENDPRLSTGLIGSASVYPSERTGYWLIPSEALIEGEQKEATIFVVKGQKAEQLDIKVEAVRGQHLYATGLPGDSSEVIISGHSALTDGMTVISQPAEQ